MIEIIRVYIVIKFTMSSSFAHHSHANRVLHFSCNHISQVSSALPRLYIRYTDISIHTFKHNNCMRNGRRTHYKAQWKSQKITANHPILPQFRGALFLSLSLRRASIRAHEISLTVALHSNSREVA